MPARWDLTGIDTIRGAVVTSTMPLNSVAEFEAGADACWWAHEQDAVSSVLADHYGREVSGLELTEPRDPADLRAAAPRLTAISNRIQAAFEQDQACAVVVPSLGPRGDRGAEPERAPVCAEDPASGSTRPASPGNSRV